MEARKGDVDAEINSIFIYGLRRAAMCQRRLSLLYGMEEEKEVEDENKNIIVPEELHFLLNQRYSSREEKD